MVGRRGFWDGGRPHSGGNEKERKKEKRLIKVKEMSEIKR